MEKKYIILLIGLIVFIVMVYFLYNPSSSDTNVKEETENVNDLETTKIKDEVNLIDYLNLEGENRKLRKEIDSLKSEIFEFHKALITPESNDIVDNFKKLNALTVYKEVSDNEIIILSRDETNDGRLAIASKEIAFSNNLSSLKNNEIINYSGANGFYAGLVRGDKVNAITVKENEKSYEAEIINFTDNTFFWYTIYDHKRKSTSDNPDKMKIEAYDKNGKVIWEDSFDGVRGTVY